MITRDGIPVAELIPVRKHGLVLGAGRNDPNVNHEVVARNDWWKPMTDEETAGFLDGRD